MTPTQQRVRRLIEMLSREAKTDEDKARAETMRKHWEDLQAERLQEDLRILMMTEARRYDDEKIEAALDAWGGEAIATTQ